jgi:hypothetical protein
VPGVWRDAVVGDEAGPLGLRGMPETDERDGGHDVPGHEEGAAHLVSGGVVGVWPEERRERVGSAAPARVWQL